MNRITFPLSLRMKGQGVADLQEALLILLDHSTLLKNDGRSRQELAATLKRESADKTFGEATSRLVSVFQTESGLQVSGAVDEATAGALNRFVDSFTEPAKQQNVVSGIVKFSGGLPASGITVSAFDRDLRSEQTLGKSETDKSGYYEIEYSDEQFRVQERASADLTVKALGANGAVLAASPVLFNAPAFAELDLTIPSAALEPPSLYERIAAAIRPLLGTVKLEELEEDSVHQDVTFLSGETELSKYALARFILAQRMLQPELPAEFWFVLLGGSFYQFNDEKSLKEQLDDVLQRLPSLDRTAVKTGLTRGFNNKEIPESFRQTSERWIEAFLRLIATRTVDKSGTATFIKSALDHAGISDTKKRESFARLYNERKALTEAMLTQLERDTSFKKEEIADLQTSFQLAELTQGDFSIVKVLKEQFSVREPGRIRSLAKISDDDWVKLIREKHAAGEINLPIDVKEIEGTQKLPQADLYAHLLERRFREAFPTSSFAGGLERAVRNGGAKGVPRAETLARFLDLHQTFEFLNTPIDDFLKNGLNPAFEPDETFSAQLKAVQRVFKLTPKFESTDALLADNIHSAQQVYRMGKSQFVRRYSNRAGFTGESARLTWNRAADTHAAVITIVTDLKANEPGSLPQVLKHDTDALSSFPNWNNLFKAGDLCECESCRSVLSPAAYFADLLMFLKDRNASNPAFSVKDVLLQRRPDLGYIELNCENAFTTLPYIDTVCEVLESVVDATGDNDLELSGLTSIPTDQTTAITAVQQAFENAFVDPINDDKWKVSLGDSFQLSQVSLLDPDRWVVHGEGATYLLTKKATPNFFAQILRNTKATSEELRAYPQYVNPKAYEKLRAAKYPSSLPFDLFAEEVRASFQKTNLQRWDLMQTFRSAAAPNNPTTDEVAAEYLGISSDPAAAFDEKRLIFLADATVAGQQSVWGEGGAGWLDQVANVKKFLEKTNLEYNDLLALLDLKFINPDGDITILHLDPSCDTDKKVIQNLDTAKLDRIHRFLRLWRKLKNWKVWELDLVVRHPNIGNGNLDEALLVSLFYFGQTRTRLGTKATVEMTCALFGDLNTSTRFTALHEKREDALYQKLFLNRRLINPLDAAFQLDPNTGDLPAGETITVHHPVLLATLSLRETDLVLFKELTRASDGAPYISDDLTLANLSFLWRHAWLSKLLKFKPADWKLLLKILSQDLASFANPAAAWEFLKAIDQINATQFTPDELNWLLSADRTAKASVKESDAVRFLASLRNALQQIKAEYDPAHYDFLVESPPTNVDSLNALLTSLLQKLNRDESGVDAFLKTLRGAVHLEASVQDLPAGFAFPATITVAPNHIPISYDESKQLISFDGLLTEDQRNILITDPSLAAVNEQAAYLNAIEELNQQSLAAPNNFVSTEVDVALPGVTLPPDQPSIPIRYNVTTQKLSYLGVMTDAERAALTLAGNPASAIDELFNLPRLAVKFFEPIFVTDLKDFPSAIDFAGQLTPDVAAKISYDAEQRQLRFAGIMTLAEQAALHALVPNVLPEEVAFHNAVNDLALQPNSIVFPDRRIWLTDGDLDVSLPSNDTLAKRMANAAEKALSYLSSALVEDAIMQQCSALLGLTVSVTRYLLTEYDLLPDTLLAYLSGAFAASNGLVDYTTLKPAFDGWYWLNRVAAVLKKWKVTLPEIESIRTLTTPGQLLDFISLPLDSAGPLAPIERFLRTARLIRLRDRLPEEGISFLEVLGKLNDGSYDAEAAANPPITAQQLFAADVNLLNDAWAAADVEALTSALDVAYPADFLLVETWERLQRVFYFLDNLTTGANSAQTFAAAAMNAANAQTIKELLRAKFGEETWLTLCAEIQDALRERKRDALLAYLLTQPMPGDAPSGKWENSDDLYAYYLLDIEMSSCQLTSRLVQGSGSIQLFVQRCFMGLEPDVQVIADGDQGDTAWRWWEWMSKYRVWEANRKVFLWPENWIEPELKVDRSSFFKDVENYLMQNEIDEDSAEDAFETYLDQLDGVAQLQIAGFYQEDDADETIIHVFGRTKGAEPHTYYYRTFDYRQWSPWEKVDLDIQGDYLIPVVVNRRLFLFWPVFTEVPDENGNATVKVPSIKLGKQSSTTVDKAWKKLRMQMAVSSYRKGKWTPKKISNDFDESGLYDIEIVKNFYKFLAIDGSEVDGRFAIQYEGSALGNNGTDVRATLSGAFEIANCKGVPEKTSKLWNGFVPVVRAEVESTGVRSQLLKWVEEEFRDDYPQEDFTLLNFAPGNNLHLTPVLFQSPGIFAMSPPWHLSYFDRLLFDGKQALSQSVQATVASRTEVPFGTWLPYFYNDKKRTFFVLPVWERPRGREKKELDFIPKYYPDIKKAFRQLEDYIQGLVQTYLDTIDFSSLPPAQKQALEQFLSQQFSELPPPPYSTQQIEDLMLRWFMRFFHWQLGLWSWQLYESRKFHFKNFYHPFVCDLAKLVYDPLKGISAMMSRETQLKNSGFIFHQTYQPTFAVLEMGTPKYYPQEVMDFTPDGAYSPYNWELFFHLPLFIANSLSKNQQFEQARDWYHYIFNPIGVESPIPGGSAMSKYWITKPFFATTDPMYLQQRIENIMRMLAGDTTAPGFSPEHKKALEDQVADWRTYPFEPHRIANYRTVAYQKTTVMKYLENLIAWGDYLFRQDSMESINEATQLYILAAEILGPRPKDVPPQVIPPVESFNELEDQFDSFSNALIQVENLVPPFPGDDSGNDDPAPLPMLYFCIPQNEKLLGYWDTVEDRLYKIRHCMNIEGEVRQLALFEPPIDPGALVKAVAAGMDISSALADMNAPLPLYRFNTLLQRANEVCSDVKALGLALLTALEKKDTEAVGRLTRGLELRLLDSVKTLREQAISEAKENLAALKKNKELVTIRRDYYQNIEKISSGEKLHQDKLEQALLAQQIAQGINIAASTAHVVPSFDLGVAGFGGSPKSSVMFGGPNVGSGLQAAAGGFTVWANVENYNANKAATNAGYQRRWDDWKFQESLANKELEQIERNIAGAELRQAMAEQDLENHVIQTENAKAIDAFMRSKYTNQELYQWQIGQTSSVYFQSYKLAYDLAKRAERCFRFELGLQDSSFINFGYWDSLKKGLLSGEKLQYDLRRLENAYIEKNRREFELSKQIPLALLDPLALVKLRETGRCFFRLPEEIFDLDFPGHYFRRIKSASITLPCVVGPYTSVSCTLRLLKNSIRINTANGDNGYAHNIDDMGLPADDTRFIENNVGVKAIATSSSQNDSGVFELNFRDERYLPFEGAGAVSEWSLELFSDLPSNNPDPSAPDFGKPLRQFDYSTISDVVIQLKYTAREDAGPFKNGAIQNLRNVYSGAASPTPSLRLFNFRQEFPGQWHQFLNPIDPQDGNVLEFNMSPDLFMLKDSGKPLKINTIWLFARCTNEGTYSVVLDPPLPPPPPNGSDTMKMARVNQYGGLHFAQKDVSASDVGVAPDETPIKWSLKMTRPGGGNLQPDPANSEMEVKDLMLAVGYQWQD